MFKFLTDSIENVLDAGECLVNPEADLPTKRQIAKLLADGVSIYAAAEMTGVAIEIVEAIADID